MTIRRPWIKGLALSLALLVAAPEISVAQGAGDQTSGGEKIMKQEELDQLLAPLALYPDSLLSQILMASTYPVEVVMAARWAEQNKDLKGDALGSALEKQEWDPSVKSLVNFPQVLQMMSEKLDWTQKLGDAFLSQQKDVLNTVQNLRKKAEAQGNLRTTEQQKVIVEKETQTIIIEPADPQVVYVPTYNPTVVYGPWWYPAYPPYYYYPPGYVAGAALFSFGVGVAVGAAWGYAWGHCNWGHGNVDIDISRNTNINRNIDRGRYADRVSSGQGGKGSWQHDPAHRKGAPYRDASIAQKYDRGAAARDAQSRDAFRGRAEAGRQDLAKGDAGQFRDRGAGGRQDAAGRRDGGIGGDGGGRQRQRDAGGVERSGGSGRSDRSAFGGYERGSQAKSSSSRGRESISSSRGGSGGGGFSRGGGGGGRGGGRR